jgi:hypothetical protein
VLPHSCDGRLAAAPLVAPAADAAATAAAAGSAAA